MKEFHITTRGGTHLKVKAAEAVVDEGFVLLTDGEGKLVGMFYQPDKVIPQP
jgi:hypothetical protein